MTYSEPDCTQAARIIEQLVEHSDEQNLARQIDAPIDRAAETFRAPPDQPYAPAGFHQTLAAFVRHIYDSAPLFGRTLTTSQAHDEAVALLVAGYRGESFDGYEGAVADAAYSSGSGMHRVLDQLKNLIKARARASYRRWLFLRHVDPANWQTRQAVATILFDGCRAYMPPELSRCSPDQFTDESLLQLLEAYTALRRL